MTGMTRNSLSTIKEEKREIRKNRRVCVLFS